MSEHDRENSHEFRSEVPDIIYPLPGEFENDGRLISRIGPIPPGGESKLLMKITHVGRHVFHVTDEHGTPISGPHIIPILPKCTTKGDIKMGNNIIRASIITETNVEELERLRDESKSYFDLAPQNLKKTALKEYEKTASRVNKRIEQLRLRDRSWEVGVGKEELRFGKAESKESARSI